jgi:hypothetical protein
MKRTAITTVLLLVLPITLSAQTGLSGKWEGKTPKGSDVLLDLSVEQETLTGTLTIRGETETIAGGKVSKKTFTFKVTHDGETQAFSGEFGGDEIKIWTDSGGAASAAVLKRAKRSLGKQ